LYNDSLEIFKIHSDYIQSIWNRIVQNPSIAINPDVFLLRKFHELVVLVPINVYTVHRTTIHENVLEVYSEEEEFVVKVNNEKSRSRNEYSVVSAIASKLRDEGSNQFYEAFHIYSACLVESGIPL
jgi:hypothetical protein